jgi:hypothetical protein
MTTYGFSETDCRLLQSIVKDYRAGHLTPTTSPTTRNPQTAGYFILLESLGPDTHDEELDGTTLVADALPLVVSSQQVWLVISHQVTPSFKLSVNDGPPTPTLTGDSAQMQTELVNAGAIDCLVWGNGTTITNDDGSTQVMNQNLWFVMLPDNPNPITLIVNTPKGGAVSIYNIDYEPADGVESLRCPYPIDSPTPYKTGTIVKATPEPGRGLVAALANNKGVQRYWVKTTSPISSGALNNPTTFTVNAWVKADNGNTPIPAGLTTDSALLNLKVTNRMPGLASTKTGVTGRIEWDADFEEWTPLGMDCSQ